MDLASEHSVLCSQHFADDYFEHGTRIMSELSSRKCMWGYSDAVSTKIYDRCYERDMQPLKLLALCVLPQAKIPVAREGGKPVIKDEEPGKANDTLFP